MIDGEAIFADATNRFSDRIFSIVRNITFCLCAGRLESRSHEEMSICQLVPTC